MKYAIFSILPMLLKVAPITLAIACTYMSILVPVSRLLGNSGTTRRPAHNDTIYTENRNGGFSSQANCPCFGCQRIHNVVLSSIHSAICLSLELKQKERKSAIARG